MARLTGPLMSLDASGSIAGALTYAKNKGRQYVRQLVIPANPKTDAQTANRAYMRFFSQLWAGLDPSSEQGSWDNAAAAANISPFNAYQGYNMGALKFGKILRTADSPSIITASVGSASFTATGHPRNATLAINPGSATDPDVLIIHRSLTTGFTPSISNVIAVLDNYIAGDTSYQDSPLEPGTYYYRVGIASHQNDSEHLITAEHAAVVT